MKFDIKIINKKFIDEFLINCYHKLAQLREQWHLSNNTDLEVTNHVLRVRIQDNSITDYLDDFLMLCRYQNKDGGWGDKRDDDVSQPRSTAFSLQMLVRANRQLRNEILLKSIIKGLDYLICKQNRNGSWSDETWHDYDATSTSVGTLLFVRHENYCQAKYLQALTAGMNYIAAQRQEDMLWYYKPGGSPIEISAHLLPKCVIYFDNFANTETSIVNLLKLQSPNGDWDSGNTDHTCDALRSTMLAASKCSIETVKQQVLAAAYKGITWLIKVSQEIKGGLGDRPHACAHAERTADGIDTFLKFNQFVKDHSFMKNFWN